MSFRSNQGNLTAALLLLISIASNAACGLESGANGAPTTGPSVEKVRIRSFRLQSRTIEVAGVGRKYLLYVPPAPDSDETPAAMPLVFMLHGGGGTARDAADRGTNGRWLELADRDRFAVAFPQGIDKQWNDCRSDDTHATGATADDVAFFSAMIADIARSDPIDFKRVYAAGISNGGMMSIRLAIEMPDRFAAVCSCVGSVAALSDCAAPTKPVPFMYMIGTADPLMPYEGGAIAVSRRNPQGRGTVLSAMESLAFWRNVNHADGMPTIENPPDTDKSDGSYVVITTWRPEGLGDSKTSRSDRTATPSKGASSTGKKSSSAADATEGAEVVYYEMIGGGHGWPGGNQHGVLYQQIVGKKNLDINGADEAWKFFSRHVRD